MVLPTLHVDLVAVTQVLGVRGLQSTCSSVWESALNGQLCPADSPGGSQLLLLSSASISYFLWFLFKICWFTICEMFLVFHTFSSPKLVLLPVDGVYVLL